MDTTASSSIPPLAGLRRFARKSAPPVESCELCGLQLAPEHDHLIEPPTRKLLCSCQACAILFSGQDNLRYRRVPRRIQILPNFQLSDEQWESLHLPINLAFFYPSSTANRVIAVYPSPAGATESLLTLEAWADLVAANPILSQLQPDVEALLVNRVGPLREYTRVPIDECFKLVGIIRIHWRGLSGGTEVWKEIAKFSESLKQRSVSTGAAIA
ncbi:MAG TPA: DUF5947 family protein [Tepidisphaeraceae bacterium]|jgi:hypothetical protein|nr:DUF5947 family protein [Tepidisphaeraceae bacterium]